jgi:spermidine synthase
MTAVSPPRTFDVSAALVTLGFTATVSQVVLMRELVATFYGNELLYGLALLAWLVWTAVGAGGLARHADCVSHPRLVFAAGLATSLPLLALQLVILRGTRQLLGVPPGAFVEFGDVLLVTLLIPILFCPLAGFLFTLAVRLLVAAEGSAGQAYVRESVGAVAGGLLVSLVFIHWLDSFQTVLLAGVLCLAAAWRVIRPARRDEGVGQAGNLVRLGGLTLVGVLLAMAAGGFLHATTLRWQWPDLAAAVDSPYGRLVAQARAGQHVFFVNGQLAFESQSTFPEAVIHFPLLAHPDPRRVLLIGGGLAGDLREVLRHPVERVVYVELDPWLVETARAVLPGAEMSAWADPRVEVLLADGRRFVRTGSERFDVIVLDLPPPATGAVNRYYTRQFFLEARARLAPGGLLALGLPSAENYWSPELVQRNASVYATLQAVFPDVLALASGDHLFLLAASAPLPADADQMSARLERRRIATRQVTPAYLAYVFANDRFAADRARLERTHSVRLNDDLTPICYYYDLALWLSRFDPGLSRLFERAGQLSLVWLAPLLALAVVLVRWRRQAATAFAIGSVGMAQMLLQVVILFAFQVAHGTLYAGVGLMVAAFMAGLAGGGALGNWLLRRWAAGAGDGHRGLTLRAARRGLIGVQAGVALFSGLLVGLLWLPQPVPEAGFAILAVIAGLLPGAAFPLAAALVGGDAHAVGRLYGADLLGGALGAVFSAALLVPLLGLPQVCLLAALIGLGGLLSLL